MQSSTRFSYSEGDPRGSSQLELTGTSSSSHIIRAISLPQSQSASNAPLPRPHRTSSPINIYPQRGSILLSSQESKQSPEVASAGMQCILEQDDKEKPVKAPDNSPSVNESKMLPHAGIIGMQSVLAQKDKEKLVNASDNSPDDSPVEQTDQDFIYSGDELEFEFDDIRPQRAQRIGI